MLVLDIQQMPGYLLAVSHKVSLGAKPKREPQALLSRVLTAEYTNKSCLGMEMESYQESSNPYWAFELGPRKQSLSALL